MNTTHCNYLQSWRKYNKLSLRCFCKKRSVTFAPRVPFFLNAYRKKFRSFQYLPAKSTSTLSQLWNTTTVSSDNCQILLLSTTPLWRSLIARNSCQQRTPMLKLNCRLWPIFATLVKVVWIGSSTTGRISNWARQRASVTSVTNVTHSTFLQASVILFDRMSFCKNLWRLTLLFATAQNCSIGLSSGEYVGR